MTHTHNTYTYPHARSHTHTHTRHTPWTIDRSVAEAATDTTQHSQGTNIHAPGGIRSCDPRKRAAVDKPYTARPPGSAVAILYIKYPNQENMICGADECSTTVCVCVCVCARAHERACLHVLLCRCNQQLRCNLGLQILTLKLCVKLQYLLHKEHNTRHSL